MGQKQDTESHSLEWGPRENGVAMSRSPSCKVEVSEGRQPSLEEGSSLGAHTPSPTSLSLWQG